MRTTESDAESVDALLANQWQRVGVAMASIAAGSLLVAMVYEFIAHHDSPLLAHILGTMLFQVGMLVFAAASLIYLPPRASLVLSALVLAGMLGGYLLAPLGGMDGPFFYSSYVLPVLVMLTPASLGQRVVTTVLMEALFVGAFVWLRPGSLWHPMSDIWAVTLTIVVVVCTYFGHQSYRRLISEHLAKRALRLEQQRVADENASLRRELRRYASRVTEMADALARADERNRSRLARDLHDDIGQVLVGTRIQLETLERQLDGPLGAGEMAEVFGLIGALEAGVRSAISELRRRPSDVDELREERELAELVAAWEASTGVAVARTGSLDELPPWCRDAAFRAAQEGLTNIARHAAKPADVAVVIRQRDTSYEVEVHNRHRGMRPVAVPGGSGLTGLRERAGQMGGALRFDLHDADGYTRLRLTLPKEPAV